MSFVTPEDTSRKFSIERKRLVSKNRMVVCLNGEIAGNNILDELNKPVKYSVEKCSLRWNTQLQSLKRFPTIHVFQNQPEWKRQLLTRRALQNYDTKEI